VNAGLGVNIVAAGGNGGTGGTTGTPNGAGATGNNGSNAGFTAPYSYTGGNGATGTAGSFGGGGGSSAGNADNGNPASGVTGGAAPAGGGAGANGFSGGGNEGTGNAATQVSGGGGGAVTDDNSDYSGGAGADGQVIISWTSCTPGTWTGVTSADWHTASNWCGGVPTSTTDVIIPSAPANQPVIGAAAVCRDMNINPGASLTITGTNTLTISGNWTHSGSFTANSSTVNYNGAAQTVAAVAYHNLTLSGSGTKTITGLSSVTGNFTMSGDNTTTAATTVTLTIGGNMTVDAGNSLTLLNANPALSVTGNTSISGTVTSPGAAKTFHGDFTVNTGGIWTEGASPVYTFNGNFTNSGSFTASNGITNAKGNFSNSGTFTHNNGTVIFNGTTLQTLGGSTATTFHNLTVNNTGAGLSLSSNETVTDTLTLTDGLVTTGANRLIVGSAGNAGVINRTLGHINGTLRRYVPNTAAPTVLYTIGGDTEAAYTPASIAFTGTVSGSGYLEAATSATAPAAGAMPGGAGLSATKYVNRRWVVTNSGVGGFATYEPTFTFVNPGDIAGSADPNLFYIRKLDGGTWASTSGTVRTGTTTKCTGLTSFSEFAIGEDGCPAISATLAGATTICNGGSANLTVTISGGTSPYTVVYTDGMTNATVTMYTSGNNIPVNPTMTSTYTLVSVTDNSGCTASTLTGSAMVAVVDQPTGPTLNTKTPDLTTVCDGQTVSATFNGGAGGFGCTDSYQYSTNNGSTWNSYTPGNSISTTGSTGVIVQGKRDGCTAGAGCSGTSFATLASWSVVAQPSGPTLNTKTPDLATVCDGQTVSATFNAGAGGFGCTDSYQYSTNNGSTWNSYTPGDPIPTTGSTGVIVQGKRDGCTAGADCSGTSFTTLASWSVVAQPTGPTLNTKTPDLTTICDGQTVSATFNAGAGGFGCTDSYQYSTNNGGTWNSYTPGDPIPTTGSTGVIVQGKRDGCTAGAGCSGTSFTTLASWSIEATPVAGNLAKTPDVATVCEGMNVSAALTAGSGGSGTDELEYRTNNGSWSSWTAYTSGNNIATTGLTGVEIRTRRLGTVCPASAYVTVSWTVTALPAAVAASGAGTFCGSTTITANNGGDGTIYFQGTTSGGTSTATASASEVVTASGTYYFRARSAAGCWGPEGSVTVTINPLPTAGTCNMVGDFCYTNNGKIDIQASGGTPSYSVTWTPAHGMSQPQTITNSGNTITITGLHAGVNYTFVVKDANNCQAP